MQAIKNILHHNKDHKHADTTHTQTSSIPTTITSGQEALHQHGHGHQLTNQGMQLNQTQQFSNQQVSTTVQPTIKHVNAAVVQEVRHRVETEVIQPIVQRDHLQTKVEQIIQPIVDKRVAPEVHQTVRDQTKEIVHGQHQAVPSLNIQGRVVDAGVEHRRVVNQPLVSERVSQTVKQEITPLIQREVIMPTVIHHEQRVHERIIEQPVLTTQTMSAISMQEASRLGLTQNMSNLSLNQNNSTFNNSSTWNSNPTLLNSSALNSNQSMLNSTSTLNNIIGAPSAQPAYVDNTRSSGFSGTSTTHQGGLLNKLNPLQHNQATTTSGQQGGLLDKLNPLHHGHQQGNMLNANNQYSSATTTSTQNYPRGL